MTYCVGLLVKEGFLHEAADRDRQHREQAEQLLEAEAGAGDDEGEGKAEHVAVPRVAARDPDVVAPWDAADEWQAVEWKRLAEPSNATVSGASSASSSSKRASPQTYR